MIDPSENVFGIPIDPNDNDSNDDQDDDQDDDDQDDADSKPFGGKPPMIQKRHRSNMSVVYNHID